jgi:taurine--2-oxoglutarate transaminase
MRPNIAAFFNDRTFQSGLTYNAHPICLAAAIANVRVMQEDRLVEHAANMGIVLHQLLAELGEQHLSVGDVRSIGLFGAIELVRDRKSREPLAPYNTTSPEMVALRNYLLDHGVYLYTHWNTLLIIPPLIIDEDQLNEGMAVIDKALKVADRSATER